MEELKKLISVLTPLTMKKMLIKVLKEPEVKRWIIEANQSQMYEQGIDSEGKNIGEYTPFTKGVKQSKGQRYDHMTLKDTGDFYKSMLLNIQNDFFDINADAKKTDEYGRIIDLLEEYGKEILGLTEENLKKLENIIIFQMYYIINNELLKRLGYGIF